MGVNQGKGSISTVSSARQGAGLGALNTVPDDESYLEETAGVEEQGLSGRKMLQLSSIADQPTGVAGTSASLHGVSRSSVSQARPDRDVQVYGRQSGSSGQTGAIGGANVSG